MNIQGKIKRYIPAYLALLFDTDAEHAYDMWSATYDEQPDNLMLSLDEVVFAELIENITFNSKIVADIGCGTGRHWEEIYTKQPIKIIGYDASEGMLAILKSKYPLAETYKLQTNHLEGLPDSSCDIIISTLAIAHIKNIADAFSEWVRILKPNGDIIITDYHPEALAKGADRTFLYNGKQIAVRNYVYSIKKIKNITRKLNLEIETFIERKIDEAVKAYYEKQNALPVFERFNGVPIIYGAHFVKRNAVK